MRTGVDSKRPRVRIEDLFKFCVAAMRQAGLRQRHAEITTDVLVAADAWGVHTHGTKQLRPLLVNVRDGRLFAAAEPEVVDEGPSWLMVDGHYAMPTVTSYFAMERAIAKARETGIAYAGVRHSSHFGAAGYYARMALQHDMIGLAMCNVDPGVTVPGARGKILGTNPIAYAVPSDAEPPVTFDIATSAVAASKVFAAKTRGEAIPRDWLVDDEGLPTDCPDDYPRVGALLPMAGHKGYGLALLVEVLSAVLTGAGMTRQVKSWVFDPSGPPNEGHAFIAIHAGAMMPVHEFRARMDWLIRDIKSAPKAKNAKRIYLPGEKEWDAQIAHTQHGIDLPDDVWANLHGVADDWNIPWLLDHAEEAAHVDAA